LEAENSTPPHGIPAADPDAGRPLFNASSQPPEPWEKRAGLWVFWGDNGLRTGWSVLLAIIVFEGISGVAGSAFSHFGLISATNDFTASQALFLELISFLAILGAGAVVALMERRRGNLLAFNFLDARWLRHFLGGLLAGLVALSVLIGSLNFGGWLHFGPTALSGASVLKYASLWGAAFLVVGCVEEGIFRGYLQFTLTRGINFWWALGIIILTCGYAVWQGNDDGNSVWGVYALAAMGLIPCLRLQWKKTKNSSFWQAAWVASTLFGLIHTGNNGESWLGVFAAGSIGFVFAVSVRVTGSAWWAIGCHAAWDWSETFLYGAADSGIRANGHLLTTLPAGSPFWSGGSDGPEGSVLVLAVILLLLFGLLAVYGLKRRPASAHAAEQLAG
jgi:membrane protease YdiL (CAAX protease family)